MGYQGYLLSIFVYLRTEGDFTGKMKMKRIEIIAMREDGGQIIDRLQRRGCVEICDISDEALVKQSTASAVAEFEKRRGEAENALAVLENYSEKKPSILDQLNGKRELTDKEYSEDVKRCENTKKQVGLINELNKEISDLKGDIAKLRLKADGLIPWKELDIPTKGAETDFTANFIGTLPLKWEQDTLCEIGLKADIHVISKLNTSTNICVICLKSDADEVFSVLREKGFSEISEKSDLTPKEETEVCHSKINELKGKIVQKEERLKQLSALCPDIQFLCDSLSVSIDKYEAMAKLASSKSTVIIHGYIPEKFAQKLLNELEESLTIAAELYEPEEDEDVPVLLENGGFSRPVEGITEMYALPGKDDLDPTPIMSFFYYLFFGMMLSDAGYGLIMVLVTTVALKKFKLGSKLRQTMKMFRFCGISTVFWGALFGSWYGDLPQIIARDFFGRDIGSTAIWFEPINKPMNLLLFSFGLGIIHLFVGLGANFYKEWKAGKRLDAVFDVIPVMMTVLGAAPLAAGILVSVPEGLSTAGGYLAIAGVVLVVLTSSRSSKNIFARFFGGIYGLYNVATGYLSDILSYSRLLALGLATGCIAQVINLIGAMPSNIVLEGILLFILFLTAHTANIAINLLGAYVHTDRLQFVELFSKFYEGGGRAFEPLKVNTKYITLKEETNNE